MWGLSFVARTVSAWCWGLSGRMLCYSECFLLSCVLCSALVLGSQGGLLEILSQVPWYSWYHARMCRVPQALLRGLAPGWDLLRMQSPIGLAHLLLVHHGGPEVVTQALRLRGGLVPGEAGSKFPLGLVLFLLHISKLSFGITTVIFGVGVHYYAIATSISVFFYFLAFPLSSLAHLGRGGSTFAHLFLPKYLVFLYHFLLVLPQHHVWAVCVRVSKFSFRYCAAIKKNTL